MKAPKQLAPLGLLRASLAAIAPALVALGAATTVVLVACETAPPSPPADPQAALVEKGRRLFFNETFNGNGRTCGSCHPVDNNFTLDARFIARLPKDDPLFVAEFVPALARNFENPRLMREFGLILENLDGFDDLANRFVMRGIPHTLGLRTSIASPAGPRTGWSGDGAPGDGSLRSFATGAVIQHFTRTLNRVAGADFRLPTADELDALEAFQLSLGRKEDPLLPLALKGTVATRGQAIFLDNRLGKCNLCHSNAGANANFGAGNAGNLNFDTGVENLPDQPARLTGQKVPTDDGLGSPGDKTFNTPSLVEAADTGPFFHNNSVETIEGAVAFYNGQAFNNSPSGRLLAGLDPIGIGIRLDATQVVEVAAFLRVLNALENIRQSLELLQTAQRAGDRREPGSALRQAIAETGDAVRVLEGGGLHPEAVRHLDQARREQQRALHAWWRKPEHLRQAIAAHERARSELVQ
jgi:cytochrome c peroxidase